VSRVDTARRPHAADDDDQKPTPGGALPPDIEFVGTIDGVISV